jgi:peptidyl-dipeptidase Dcp
MPADTLPDATTDSANPFFCDWNTPYGLPPFAEIRDEHYAEAFERGLAELEEDVEAIRLSEDPPGFENTIVALNQAGQLLDKVVRTFANVTNTDTNDALQELERDFYPRLSEASDAIYLDAKLFAKVKAVHESRERLGLDAQDLRLVELVHRDFVRAGAPLDYNDRERLGQINAELSALTTQFSQNLLAETKAFVLRITDESRLAGLPGDFRAAANTKAEAAGEPEAWHVGLDRPAFEPFMTQSEDRELRRELLDGYRERATSGEHDNRDLILQIVRLRAERARLLGYETYAHYALDTAMAKTPDAALGFLDGVWKRALEVADRDADELERLAQADGLERLEAWDWWHYAERLRQERYALDEAELKPYFELWNVLGGAFFAAERLFGLRFEPVEVAAWNEGVRAYEVHGGGEMLGLFLMDAHARESKRGGAWMSTYRSASEVGGERVRPLVTNNLNLTLPPGEGAATLLSFDDVETVFHEFGHALHGLMTEARYDRFSGTSGSPRDYVEFPSQFMEHYAAEPSVLAVYARHHETGEAIPEALVAKVQEARTHNQGFKTTEYIAAALIDLAWHSLTPEAAAQVEDVRAFEVAALEEFGMPERLAGLIEPRYRSPYFSHLFTAPGGYAAGYYAYLWSEVLDADGFAAFEAAGDAFDPALAQRLAEHVYRAGYGQEGGDLYRAFRGNDPAPEPLLSNRGLTEA